MVKEKGKEGEVKGGGVWRGRLERKRRGGGREERERRGGKW